jgi:hypothetical protein
MQKEFRERNELLKKEGKSLLLALMRMRGGLVGFEVGTVMIGEVRKRALELERVYVGFEDVLVKSDRFASELLVRPGRAAALDSGLKSLFDIVLALKLATEDLANGGVGRLGIYQLPQEPVEEPDLLPMFRQIIRINGDLAELIQKMDCALNGIPVPAGHARGSLTEK